ncbi:MAG: universal stress protein [Coriobacteriia bacterium]
MNALVVTDLSDAGRLSIEGVRACGRDSFDEIVILHVIDLDLYTAGGSVPAIREWALAQMDGLVGEMSGAGYRAEGRVEQGPVVETVNHVADQIGADLIVMTNVGKSGRVLGSTAERLAASANRPVLVDRVARMGEQWCRVGEKSLLDTVLAGVEFGPHAIEFLEHVGRLPGLTHLIALHVARDETERMASISALGDAAADMNTPETIEVSSLTGDPAEMLLVRADDLDVNAIAVAPCRHGAVGRAMLGSVARSVLMDADRAVVLVPWG